MSSPSPYGSGPENVTGRPAPVVDDEAQWRRPPDGTPPPAPADPAPAGRPASYPGPPPTIPPPAGWRPPLVVQAPPPRSLPPQDPLGLDQAEGRARTLTFGIAMVSGAVMVVLVLVLCGRALFF
ncbi:hypothetical protein [Planosporangium mesophilum]|uniref:Translation initiation factor 2 n=1 Tax=Planosporangium mesophilum TaxID=689768 RepID=A0A8J3WYH3_9ACTN|nr:hypothetical protein [Planosporangium mesophilum]GII21275.1 hypothetical protein Pme01_08720 [Planosporangium mesophilum]